MAKIRCMRITDDRLQMTDYGLRIERGVGFGVLARVVWIMAVNRLSNDPAFCERSL